MPGAGPANTVTEEKEFVLRFSLSANFGREEDSEQDGYAWLYRWEEEVKPAVLRAVVRELQDLGGFRVHVRNRGVPQTDEVELVLELARPTSPS
jgi:hypothetical protein